MKDKDHFFGENMRAIILAVVVIVVIVGGILILSILSKNDSDKGQISDANKDSDNALRVEATDDGKIDDYEKAGYIKLPKYEGLSVTVTPTDDEVDGEIMSKVEEKYLDEDNEDAGVSAWSKLGAQKTVGRGDYVRVDFAGSVDGVALENLEGSDEIVHVGDYEYEDDFENGMIGMSVGETKSVDVRFPTDYDDDNVAGKTVRFAITATSKFNDALIAEMTDGKYNDVETYRGYIKKKLKKDNISEQSQTAWDDLMEDVDVDHYPDGLTEEARADQIRQYESFANVYETTYEDILAQFGMDDESINSVAADTVKERLAAKTIAYRQKLDLSDEEYQKRLKELADEDDNTSFKEVEKDYIESTSVRPRDDVYVEIAKEYVADHASTK